MSSIVCDCAMNSISLMSWTNMIIYILKKKEKRKKKKKIPRKRREHSQQTARKQIQKK
jgi:hypothetical protein